MSFYPHETEQDDGLTRLGPPWPHWVVGEAEDDYGRPMIVLDCGCWQFALGRIPGDRRDEGWRPCCLQHPPNTQLLQALEEIAAHFAELSEIWTAYRDSVYERSGLTQCCDAPRMHTWERDGDSNLGPDRCDCCRGFVDSCGRRFEP